MHTHYIFIIHWPVEGHLGSFHSLALVNRTAVNTAEQEFVDRESFGDRPRSRIARSWVDLHASLGLGLYHNIQCPGKDTGDFLHMLSRSRY